MVRDADRNDYRRNVLGRSTVSFDTFLVWWEIVISYYVALSASALCLGVFVATWRFEIQSGIN